MRNRMPHTSSEILTMDKGGTEEKSKIFKTSGGWFVKKETIFLLGLAYVCTIVTIGVLVYYLAPCEPTKQVQKPPEVERPKKLQNFRLPTHLIPQTYTVKLKPLFNKDHVIAGESTVNMLCKHSSNNITLHILDIKILEKWVKDSKSKSMKIKKTEEDVERQFYIIYLEDNLKVGETYSLYTKFEANLNDKLAGFYRSTYTNKDNKKIMIGTTQFQATDARRAFPCFDEPDFKANFTISLGRMKNMTSISNMDLVNQQPEDDLWIWDNYAESVKMSTYLIAFVVSDFIAKDFSKPGKSWKFGIYGRKNAIDNGEADYAGLIGPDILDYFEEFYNVKYPLPKCDMIAIPDFAAGAMENWGLITYRETALLYDPDISAARNKMRVAVVVAHELAHQWFGNLVTPKWWTDLWLNEGFASYVEYLGVDKVQRSWRMLDQIVVDSVQYVMLVDSLESSHPISIPVGHPDEISSIFDGISYSKGASIIRMMDFFLTSSTFRKGLTNYLNEFSFSTAEQDDLWHYLTVQAHQDKTLPQDLTVKDIMDTWTLQMGYPVVTVKRNYNDNSVLVSQERFLLSKNPNSTDEHKYSWWVPVTYTNKQIKDFQDTKPKHWIKKDQASIEIKDAADKDDWVIFNIQEGGYYRVNYDKQNWKLLIDQLNSNHQEILPIQRSQIIDDGMNLARAGLLDYNTALSLLEYLRKEKDYFPLYAAFFGLKYLDSMLERTAGYGEYKTFMRKIMDPLYETIDFDSLENVDTSYPYISDTFKNISIVSYSCYFGNEACISEIKERFQAFRNDYKQEDPDNPNNQIIPDLKSVIYCNTIRHGGDDEWNFFWNHYKLSKVASEKATVLVALGCSREVWILSSYLNMMLDKDSGIRSQDIIHVFGSVARNPVGVSIAWDFLRDKWEPIKTLLGASLSGLARMVKSVTKDFNTAFQIKQIQAFKEANKGGKLRSAKRATDQAIETAQANVRWMEKNYEDVVSWLEQRNNKP